MRQAFAHAVLSALAVPAAIRWPAPPDPLAIHWPAIPATPFGQRPNRKRQQRAFRKLATSSIALVVAGAGLGTSQLAARGVPFFVFRENGAGASETGVTDAGFFRPAPAVTPVPAQRIPLHAVDAVAPTVALGSYTVRAGDTLSSIADKLLGSKSRWPALWYPNRKQVTNPNMLAVGVKLVVPSSAEMPQTVVDAAMNAIPKPPPPVILAADISVPQGQSSAPQTPAFSGTVSGTVSTDGDSSFEACVIERESGGNPNVMNSTGHYGLFQFDYGTWVSGGGNPADFGHASVAEQDEVFANVFAARGSEPWAPSDGC